MCHQWIVSSSRANTLTPEFRQALEKFMECLWKYNPQRNIYWRSCRAKKNYRCYVGPKYVCVVVGNWRKWQISRDSGDLSNTRYLGYYGNLFVFADENKWAKGGVRWDGGSNISDVTDGKRECELCGRTKSVMKTVVGWRCQYCRASDSRHMGMVRQLGGTPNVNGVPFSQYLVK